MKALPRLSRKLIEGAFGLWRAQQLNSVTTMTAHASCIRRRLGSVRPTQSLHPSQNPYAAVALWADHLKPWFCLPQAPAHHLDTHYTIFGELVSGWPVAEAINALSRGKKDNTATQDDGARIADSGQIRKGSVVPDINKA